MLERRAQLGASRGLGAGERLHFLFGEREPFLAFERARDELVVDEPAGLQLELGFEVTVEGVFELLKVRRQSMVALRQGLSMRIIQPL